MQSMSGGFARIELQNIANRPVLLAHEVSNC